MKVKVTNVGGRSRPQLFCDICGKLVETSFRAEYLIPELNESESAEIIVGHTDCTKSFEKTVYEKNGATFGNMSVENLMVYLVSNLGFDYLEAERNTAELKRVGDAIA